MIEEERQILGERDFRIAEIRANTDWTPEAKQRREEEIREWAQSEVAAVREHEKQKMEARLAQAKKAVFEIPTGNKTTGSEQSQIWAGFRSAYKDVLLATEDPLQAHSTLQSIMDQAERTGDAHLARAVYHRSIDLGIQEIIARYHSTRPKDAQAWRDYIEAEQEMEQSKSPEGLLAQAMNDRAFVS